MNSYRGSFHDSNMPQQQQQQQQGHLTSVYRADTKVDFNCLGCPSCNFCTKVRRDMLKHEAQHWDPRSCICARLNQRAMAAALDTKICPCGRLTFDENARMLRNWEDEQTRPPIQRFGMSETMPTYFH
jgi:hypothetical protein